MAVDDVWFFELIAPVYDLFMPGATGDTLAEGLARAEGEIHRLLDVGGGTGRAARAIDAPSRIVLDASGRMLRRVPDGVDAVRGDARELPVRDGSIDGVLIVDAYHHLPDPERVLEACARALRPGGVLVIQEFGPSTLRGRLLATGEHLARLDSHFHTPADLVGDLRAVGFTASVVEAGFAYTVAGTKPGA
jgi:demethylmenaquinone methyltransferase/2-methoxy-6-polyprenyl-1,4-benzoquinol methylase